MLYRNLIGFLFVGMLLLIASVANAMPLQPTFKQFIQEMRLQALKKGVSAKTLDTYLSPLQYTKPKQRTEKSLKHERRFVHYTTFDHYRRLALRRLPVKVIQAQLRKHRDVLLKIYKKYQVQPRFIVALWGFESGFGSNMGNFKLVPSLATLAYQNYRSKFYRTQLIYALKMLDQRPPIPQQLISTFDGGMGQPQFEPQIYFADGVDFDGDGFANIWTSAADSLASIANYLHKDGWDGKQNWGYEVTLTSANLKQFVNKKIKKSVAQWNKLGVRLVNGKILPKVEAHAFLYQPSGSDNHYYLLLPNFERLMEWNRSHFEGLMVGYYGDHVKPLVDY